MNLFNRYRTGKKFATGLCVPFVDISREFVWPLKRHGVLYRLTYAFPSNYESAGLGTSKGAVKNQICITFLDQT